MGRQGEERGGEEGGRQAWGGKGEARSRAEQEKEDKTTC